MNLSSPRLLVGTLAVFALAGCASNQQGGSLGHSLGAIETSDIKQANQLRDLLPGYLGYPSASIRVEAGSGVTHVTVYTKNDSTAKQALIAKLQDLEKQNASFNPIKLLVMPEDDSIFSRPTLIQK